MEYVNYFLIEATLAPLTIRSVTSNGELTIDPDDTVELRQIINAHVVPYVEQWSDKYREKLRLSLACFLQRPDVLDRVLASQQDLEMPEPSDLVGFFCVLWECLFPGQDAGTVDLSHIEEDNDMMEINLTHQG